MVTATPAQTSVTLNWSPDTTALLGYKTFLFNDAAGLDVRQTWTDNFLQSGTNSIQAFGLTAATQYWYKVSPKDPSGAVDGFGLPLLVGNCAIQTFTTLP